VAVAADDTRPLRIVGKQLAHAIAAAREGDSNG
jgi:hypothetical protein